VPAIDVGDAQDREELTGEERLAQARQRYGQDLGFLGAKQRGHGPEMWGITLEQLSDIPADVDIQQPEVGDIPAHRGKSMYKVVNDIVKPQTKGKGMGYALLVNQSKPLEARIMVSHAWGEKYRHFVKALKTSGVDGPFWVCAMAIYQNEDIEELTIEKQLGPHPSGGPFATVLKQAALMVAVVTPQCDIYTRLWCVYEIFVAVNHGVPVELANYESSIGRSARFLEGATYQNIGLDTVNKPADTSSATCGNAADQQMICGEIQKHGGFRAIDDAVTWVRVMALIKALKNPPPRGNDRIMFAPCGYVSEDGRVPRLDMGIAQLLRTWKGH